MKIKALFLLSFAFAAMISKPAFAQMEEEAEPTIKVCGTTEAVEQSLLDHPELLQNIQNLDLETRQYLTGEKVLDSTITIPVVFHVFHTYGSERIGEPQMKDCIRIINEDFQKLNPDTNQITAAFKPIAGTGQIRFRLAKKDPTGKCTKGINYIYSPLHTNGGENLKSIVSWDTKRYLNIWVCSSIGSGAAAYSYYPGTAPGQSKEGVVSMATYVGSIGSSGGNYNARTLTHEIGHYMNLPHCWGSSNTPGAASNCNLDDGVDDTPNCVGVTGAGCNLNQTSCGSLDNVENHMEYSSCRRMFTKGQVTRMHAAAKSTTGFRSSLWQGSNLVFTGTTNNGPGPECPPTADFKSNLSRVCAGVVVTFTQLAYNVTDQDLIQYSWTFEGGTPATSTEKVQQVTFTEPGQHSVKLVVQNSAGKDSITRVGIVTVLATEPAYFGSQVESFETPTFPTFAGEPLKTWEISSTITNTWKRTTTAHVTGTASLMIQNQASSNGSIHTMFSPVFQLEGPTAGAKIALKYAYAQRAAANTDKLTISYSTDCGKTWYSALSRSGATLSTTSGVVAGSFFPSVDDWKQLNLNLTFLNNPRVRFKIEFTSAGGNNIFLEDIQVTTVVPISNLQDESLSLAIVPNPSSVLPRIMVSNDMGSYGTVEIVDALGRQMIWKKRAYIPFGNSEIDLSQEIELPPSGAYWVRLVMPNRVMVRKWIVLP